MRCALQRPPQNFWLKSRNSKLYSAFTVEPARLFTVNIADGLVKITASKGLPGSRPLESRRGNRRPSPIRTLILRQNMGSWAYYEGTILAARSGDLGAIGLLKDKAAQVGSPVYPVYACSMENPVPGLIRSDDEVDATDTSPSGVMRTVNRTWTYASRLVSRDHILSLADQAVVSGTSFLTTILIARFG